jgi:hypothetical protein
VPVTEMHGGQTVWQGIVAVFDLAEHLKAPTPMRGRRLLREARAGRCV